MSVIAPGATIGILGGGQLGRMLAIAAAQLGYRTHIFAPEVSGPAADVSPLWTQSGYDDADALAAFAGAVDIITYEFENVPEATVRQLAALGHVRPNGRALAIAQDRLAEKAFVRDLGGQTAPYAPVPDRSALDAAVAAIGVPAILKTVRFGYDGKGQARLTEATPAALDTAWAAIGGQSAVLEGLVAFQNEYSVLVARGADGQCVTWDVPENVHVSGILATSTVPASTAVLAQAEAATAMAIKVASALDYIGVLACEFFASADGPVFNEMAPRVHNSGHWTIEGAVTSQFENHIRAICGLPLGSAALAAAGVQMHNLVGDQAHDWGSILTDPRAHLHLYGKHEARPGRKMGHVTRMLP
jgi:5-(carboxyamino)imidazole ribonucleotide synthase